jgi:photosystem II stability/assembly factor-like uncharacterized protein
MDRRGLRTYPKIQDDSMKALNPPGSFLRAILGALITGLLVASACTPKTPALAPAAPPAAPTTLPPAATMPPATVTLSAILQASPSATLTTAPSATPSAIQTAASPVVNPTLTRIDMLDEKNGWGLTAQGVLRTADGGSQWIDVTPPGLSEPASPPHGFFLSLDTAWILVPRDQNFSSGTLYHTTDAGKTWASTEVPFSGDYLDFLDAQHGWALFASDCGAGSCGGSLFYTGDGGNTWTELLKIDQDSYNNPLSLPLAGNKTGVTFASQTHGWVTGMEPMDNYAWLFITRDGGRTWRHQNLMIPADYPQAQLVVDPPHFFSQQEGLLPVNIFSLDKSSRVFYVTHDAGETWNPTTPVGISGVYSLISIEDVRVWDGETLMVTQDGGKTWQLNKSNVNLSQTISQVDFVNKDTAWVLSTDADGKVNLLSTTDGGSTWTPLH